MATTSTKPASAVQPVTSVTPPLTLRTPVVPTLATVIRAVQDRERALNAACLPPTSEDDYDDAYGLDDDFSTAAAFTAFLTPEWQR